MKPQTPAEHFARRTRAIVDAIHEPVTPDAPLTPVLDVRIVPRNACDDSCGFCGRCSAGPEPNAQCGDCGEPFWLGHDDTGRLCDACCDRRDAHTDLNDLKRMAKAVLRIDPTTIKDVA
jgi:hypothetical protein